MLVESDPGDPRLLVGHAGRVTLRVGSSRIDSDSACASSPSASARRIAAGPAPRGSSASHRHERGALQEIEDAEAGGKARAARGRQHMVGPGDIVADRFGRIAAEKDRAGVVDPLGQRLGVVERQLEMLGRDPVDQRRRLAPNRATRMIAPCASQLARAISRARQAGEVALDRGFATAAAKSASSVIEDRLRRVVVLGLRQQIGGDPCRVVVPVGDDQDFRWAGDHVDADPAEDPPLGRRDIGVARPDDLVDRRDRRRAISQRRDRLRAADPVDFVDPDELRRGQHQRVEHPVRRRHDHRPAARPPRPWRGSRSSAPRTGRRPCRPAHRARRPRAAASACREPHAAARRYNRWRPAAGGDESSRSAPRRARSAAHRLGWRRGRASAISSAGQAQRCAGCEITRSKRLRIVDQRRIAARARHRSMIAATAASTSASRLALGIEQPAECVLETGVAGGEGDRHRRYSVRRS